MSPQAPPVPVVYQALGEAFLEALKGRDFNALFNLFQPNVRSRLLLPSGLSTPTSAAELGGKYESWFSEADQFEVTSFGVSRIGLSLAMHYSIRLHQQDGWFVVEQKTYSEIADGRIQFFDLLCSGVHPAE